MGVGTFRYRYGDADPIKAPLKQNNGINIGDLCYSDNTDTVTPPDFSGTLFPCKSAASFPYAASIADPTSGPTLAVVSTPQGPGFASGASYKVQYTYVTSDGVESGPSSLSSALGLLANQGINVTGVSVPAGIVATNWYVTNLSGALPQLVAQTAYGAGLNIVGPPPSDAPAPPAVQSLSQLLLSQVAFAKRFLGVSGQFYDGNSFTVSPFTLYGVKDGYIRIDTGGIFDFSCASANFNDGDSVGIAKASGSALDPTSVVAVTQKAAAIGRVYLGGISLTTVRIKITPALGRISEVKF